MENITPNEQNIVETPAEQTPKSTTSKIVENVANKATDALVSTGKSLAKAGMESGAKAIGGSVTKAFAPLIMKILIGTAIAGAVAGGGAALIKHIKESDALKISDTPNVVEKIKQISEFTTYTYIEEFVIHDQKAEAKDASAIRTLFNKEAVADTLRSEIVIITRGVVRAGYDLAKIGTDDIKASNDTISVTLPAPEVFDIIINPSDNRVFVEEGKWSHEEITALQVDCRNKLQENAINSGILENAEKAGVAKLQSLFKTFGYNVVEINN